MKHNLPPASYCNGKRSYDKRGAITAANLRYEQDRVKLRLYPCGDHWHLTKQMRGLPYHNRRVVKGARRWRYSPQCY